MSASVGGKELPSAVGEGDLPQATTGAGDEADAITGEGDLPQAVAGTGTPASSTVKGQSLSPAL